MVNLKEITLTIKQPFNLSTTLESGQAFRWQLTNGWYFGTIQKTLVGLKQDFDRLHILTSNSELNSNVEASVSSYLRLDDDLAYIYSQIATDSLMDIAINKYWGLRILRQDPWECLISFICSANSNIPRISSSMKNLSQYFGERLVLGDYVGYSFPSPTSLYEAGEGTLRDLKLGFRAKYVHMAAERVSSGTFDLESLRNMHYLDAKDELTSLVGVGSKVADCVLLFSLDKLDACPIDRWVRRVLEEAYLDNTRLSYDQIRGWSIDKWGMLAGYAQQYLFHYKRLLRE